ncbi:hypothetical protein ACS0PU_007568 [Formica fusca]
MCRQSTRKTRTSRISAENFVTPRENDAGHAQVRSGVDVVQGEIEFPTTPPLRGDTSRKVLPTEDQRRSRSWGVGQSYPISFDDDDDDDRPGLSIVCRTDGNALVACTMVTSACVASRSQTRGFGSVGSLLTSNVANRGWSTYRAD